MSKKLLLCDAWLNGEVMNGYRLSPEAIQQLKETLPGTPIYNGPETWPMVDRKALGFVEEEGGQFFVRITLGVQPGSLLDQRPSLDIMAQVIESQPPITVESAELRGIFIVPREDDYPGGFDLVA